MDQVKDGAIVLFGDASVPSGTHFRQDNDFFYFTGVEDLGAVLVMIPSSRAGATLFLPQRSAREIQYDGPGLLEDADAKAKAGFADVQAVGDLDEFLARLTGSGAGKLYLRLSPRDKLDGARSETALWDGRRSREPLQRPALGRPVPDREAPPALPADAARGRRPGDRRPAGHQDARGDRDPAAQRRASRPRPSGRPCWPTRPGVFEYEIEAAAMAVVLQGRGQGRRLRAHRRLRPQLLHLPLRGELPPRRRRGGRAHGLRGRPRPPGHGHHPDLAGLGPVHRRAARGLPDRPRGREGLHRGLPAGRDAAGRPRPRRRRHEGQGARSPRLSSAASATASAWRSTTSRSAASSRKAWSSPSSRPSTIPEKDFGVRIEDTVLITKTGCEVLTKGVPKEIDEVEKLLAGRGR
ncbi:MAG: aminopeptidase P N-terminal domain-containing protein [Marinilabiliales bacterium]|nr:aminopeptidase P N-terminal domain-containing protein [Marinilabiliales bacterium]